MQTIVIIASFPDSIVSFRGELISALQDQQLSVHVIAPQMSDEILLELESRNITVHQIELERTGLNPISDIKSLFQMYKVIKKIKPNYSLAYTIKPVIYGSIAAKLAGVPSIFSLITGLGYAFTGEVSGKRKILQKFLHTLYRLALMANQTVFFQNNDDKNLFQQIKLVPEKINPVVVNGSGIDINAFKTTDLPVNKFNFLLIARLLGDKGIREYAKAAEMLKASHPHCSCKLVGWIDNNPDAILQRELDEWSQSGYIEYLGRFSDVQPVIAQSSVYVLPSYREGTPRTVLEAMAMGRPIITTDAPGCRETVIDNENGFLIPVQNVQALYESMVKFVESPELIEQMGKASRKIAEDKYDVNKVNYSMLSAMGLVN
jgi:glycosyltransferase involved in cell wall biosynthesis